MHYNRYQKIIAELEIKIKNKEEQLLKQLHIIEIDCLENDSCIANHDEGKTILTKLKYIY